MSSEPLRLSEQTLRGNWIEGAKDEREYAYTRPSPSRYPWQWYWDSCFHAIVWRRFNRARARAELESLLGAQREDGFIGHTIFWDHPVTLSRLGFYNVDSRNSFTTDTIQPPLLAWAWLIATGEDPGAEKRIAAHHEWLRANRDLDGDGLLWIHQPDESGLDSSPKFDPVWGRRAHGRLAFPCLIRKNRKLRFNARRVLDAGGPLVCEVVVNVLWCLSRLATGQSSVTPALIERLWDERRGLFLDSARGEVADGEPLTGGDRRIAISTWAGLAPLALPDLPEEIGRRLVEEHLLDPARYWTPVPPPSVSAEEPAFEPGRRWFPFRRYWRGPSWVNSAWLLWLGLQRLGYEDPAQKLATAMAGAVAREGLREFYDPHDGTGMGAESFGWSTLVCELAEPDPAAASSYLAGAPVTKEERSDDLRDPEIRARRPCRRPHL